MISSDHDSIIRLIETVKNNHLSLSEKLDGVKTDVHTLKNDQTVKLVGLDTRVRALEELRDKLNPDELIKQVDSNTQWIHDFSLRWRMVITIVATSSSIVTFIMASIVYLLKIIGK